MFLICLILIDQSQIKLKHESMYDLSFDNYEKNFIFIVNNKKFYTNRIVADILSPVINKMHLTEPKSSKYTINTKTSGNFSIFLQLINFNFSNIPENEIPFINEVSTILGNHFIEIKTANDQSDLTVDISIENIKKYEEYPNVYSRQIDRNVDFLSTHFYLLNMKHSSVVCTFKKFVLDKIFNHSELCLESEDQLLNIINSLYSSNSNYSYMYEYVEFDSVSNDGITSFMQGYNYKDLTQKVWHSISTVVGNNKNTNLIKKHKYFRKITKQYKVNDLGYSLGDD